MVQLICGLPEPPNGSIEDTISANNDIVFPDTDTDEELNEYNNYEPLPLNSEDCVSEEEEDSEDEGTEGSPIQVQPATTAESSLVTEVWSSATPKDIELDSSKIDEVKELMKNVTLPASSIPEWANSVPESIWKATLLQKINSNLKGD